MAGSLARIPKPYKRSCSLTCERQAQTCSRLKNGAFIETVARLPGEAVLTQASPHLSYNCYVNPSCAQEHCGSCLNVCCWLLMWMPVSFTSVSNSSCAVAACSFLNQEQGNACSIRWFAHRHRRSAAAEKAAPAAGGRRWPVFILTAQVPVHWIILVSIQ